MIGDEARPQAKTKKEGLPNVFYEASLSHNSCDSFAELLATSKIITTGFRLNKKFYAYYINTNLFIIFFQ